MAVLCDGKDDSTMIAPECESLTYQLRLAVWCSTVVITGSGKSGFGSEREPKKRRPLPRQCMRIQFKLWFWLPCGKILLAVR